MPNISVIEIILLTVAILAGIVTGWWVRGKRARQEKAALNASWKERIDAQRGEHKRLVDQNQGLMEQVSQFQASGKDASNRARELSTALKEAFERRDHLQREIKDVRGELDAARKERRRLETDLRHRAEADNSLQTALREKDDKIFKLSRELESWQDRLPPLIQRYRERDADAKRLETDLDRAYERILEIESGRAADHTHVESVDRGTMSRTLDASNDAGAEDDGAGAPLDVNGAPLHDGRDDLKEIKGIGPAIERTLHELGFFRFRQIAEMSEYDINRVAQRLKGFRSRIYREDWIGQARELDLRRSAH